jgi:hypothetical protein
MTMPVNRPMTPAPKFGPIPVWRTIVMTLVEFAIEPMRRAIVIALLEFVIEPGARAIKMTPGLIAPIAVTDAVPVKILISGSIKFLKASASIRTAVAASFALGP